MKKTLVFIAFLTILVNCSKRQPESENYRIKHGDNITTIAKKYNVTVDDIKEWNNLANDKIHVNQNLRIYYNSLNSEKVRFGMTEQQVISILGIPPRLRNVSENNQTVELVYNVESKNIGSINNKSIAKLEYYEVETVVFGFLNNSLSFISYDYRDIKFQEYYDELVKKGYKFTERDPGYWDGKGIFNDDSVVVDLANMPEEGYVWCTYYHNVPEIINFYIAKTK